MSHDARAAFSRATELHRQGKLDEAIEIYRRLNKTQPAFEVQRLLVFAQLQAGRVKDALVAARRARDAYGGQADAHVLLGAALQANRALHEALAAYEAAVVLAPDLAEAHFLAGKLLTLLGRHEDAIQRFDRVLALDPRASEALAHRAAAALRHGARAKALEDYDALTAMQPWVPEHWLSKAEALLPMGRFSEAVAAADAALACNTPPADAHLLRGRGLLGLGAFAAARRAFEAAIGAAPWQMAWRADLSRLARLEGSPREALSICNAAIAAEPQCVPALQERAEAHRDLGELAEALADVQAALALDAEFAPAQATLAGLEVELGQRDAAEAAVAAALGADPGDPLARFLDAELQLAHGQWAEGWAGFESRAALTPPLFHPLGFARWDGVEPVDDLIVLGEQRLGDQLLCARLLRVLADRGIRARMLVAPAHAPLLRRIDARVPVIADLDGVDLQAPGLRWVPLMSLPGLLEADPARWPTPPYLTADSERVARWRDLARPPAVPPAEPDVPPVEDGADADAPPVVRPELPPVPPPELPRTPLRIGIAWQDDPPRPGGGALPLAAFAPLAALEGVELVSLQSGAARDDLQRVPFADRVVQLPPERDRDGTFVDTAGILQHLDLVVTGDSSLGDLAGARGRPAFIALAAVAGWRWGVSGDRSIFYPSLRLFRQTTPGDWAEVFARITAAVAERLAARA